MGRKKKNKENNDFFEGLWKAMGNYAGLKLAAFLFVVLGGGGTVLLKSCNLESTPATENPNQSEPRPMNYEQQKQEEAEEAVKGRG